MMKFLNFTQTPNRLAELKQEVDQAAAIQAMTDTEGWKLLRAHLENQLELYKTQILLECRDWENYNELRGKAFGIQLLMVDVEDFIDRGARAEKEIEKLNS